MDQVLVEDLGENVSAWAARINGSIVCLATPKIEHDATARRHVRATVTRLGGNCATCRGCPIGREVA